MTTRATAPPAPRDAAGIGRALDHAVHQGRVTDEHIAALTLLWLASTTRDNHPDAATITLAWTDQPGTSHLAVETVHDHHGHEITDAHHGDYDTAFNLTDSTQHTWQPLLTHGPSRDTYRLDIAAMLAAAPTLTALTAHQPDEGNPTMTTDDPDTAADLRRDDEEQETRPPITDTATDAPAAHPRSEVITYRDPESGIRLAVFADGVQLEPGSSYEWCHIDPHCGDLWSEWYEDGERSARHASPAAAEVIRQWYRDGANTEHIN